MGSIRARKETGHLFFDFSYQGVRCREQTTLPDTPANRRTMNSVLVKIEKAVKLGTFVYSEFFPDSPKSQQFDETTSIARREQVEAGSEGSHLTPLFKVFVELWISENEIAWKASYRETIRSNFNLHLIPFFGNYRMTAITKEDILRFRKILSEKKGKRGKNFSPSRINKLMGCLRAVLDEASSRFGFPTPFVRIKHLHEPRAIVEPFTLEEIDIFLRHVVAKFHDYYLIRFFTGMRTAEIDGLKWQYVDFENRQILIRETIVLQREETPKTDESLRTIPMLGPVYEAFRRLFDKSGQGTYVFTNDNGRPLSHQNMTNRIWYPTLERAELRKRSPYQTRHTAATLWLASGENPEWIARVMGHANTRMLFTVYSRYVPNLTRRDGSAFEQLLNTARKGGKDVTDQGTH